MSETGLDVAACVRRARQGDEQAARELADYLYPLVYKLVRRICRNGAARKIWRKLYL